MTQDLTVGKPISRIWQFAVPVLFGLLLQQVYSLVDTAIVGHALGVMALGVHDAEDAAQRANLERVTEWLTAIDQPFITPDDIRHQLWGKLICNVGVNQACAVYDCCFSGIHAPGEAREADIGIAGGNGEALLFAHGEILRKVPEEEIIPTLLRALEDIRRTREGRA